MLLKIFVVCITIILTACGGGGGDSTNGTTQNPPISNGTENQPVADVSLASGVVVLSEKTKSSIIASDANTVTFSGQPADSIKSGTVFIVGEDARKVLSVTTVDGNTLVSTVQPTIVEVFSSIKLDADIALTSQNIDQKSLATGISIEKSPLSNTAVGILTTTTSSNGITLSVKDEKFLDLNTNGSVRMVNPNIKINYEWKNGDLVKPAQIKFTSSTDVNLNFDSKESHGGSKSYPLFSFRVPVPVPILGGTLNIHIPVNLKLEAKLNGELSVGFTNNSILDFSVSAQNVNAPLVVANNSTNNFSFKTPTLKTELNLGAYIQPDVSLSIILFDIGGFKNTGGVSVTGTLEQDVGGQFKNCVRITADAKASATAYLMLPIKPFTFKADIYDQSWRLYEGNTGVNAVCNLAVSPINDSLAIGSVRQFKAEIKDTFNNPVSITPTLQWESSDPAIATVSATGLVTAVKEGSTQITVTDVDSKRSATATVAVNLPIITITPNTPFVGLDSSVQLNATATDLQGNPITIPTFVWASNNTGVTVSNTGLVTAASTATGDAVITAKDPASGAIDTVIVKLKLLDIYASGDRYNSHLYDVTALEKGASLTDVIWTSDNPNVTFSKKGGLTKLTAAPDVEGAVIVTATDPSSGAKGTKAFNFEVKFQIITDVDTSYIRRKTASRVKPRVDFYNYNGGYLWSKLWSFKVMGPKDTVIHFTSHGIQHEKVDCGSWTQGYNTSNPAMFTCTRSAFMPVSTTITFQVKSACYSDSNYCFPPSLSAYDYTEGNSRSIVLNDNDIKTTVLPDILKFTDDIYSLSHFF